MIDPITIDPITLEVLRNRLISIVDEQAAALIHASFTTVVREAGDLSAGVFDARGRMLAQAVTGTPGHINTMANCVRDYVVPRHPLASLSPGDTLITNDPWAASGHLFDFTVVTPVFHRGRGVGWFANTCHATDIGGLSMGADATEVFEEGLAVPLLKLFRGGEPNGELLEIVRANVRMPDMVIGDLYAQHTGNLVGARKLVEMLDEYELPDVEAIGEAILDRTEDAVRAAIREIPDGTYRSAVAIDGFDDPLRIECRVEVAGDAIAIDYAGSSPQVERGINVVMNYTHAYSTYTVMTVVAPAIPNNEGAFRPMTITAPPGSILNCRRPAAVAARHLIGHFVSQPILTALGQAVPERVMAEGSAGLWNTMLEGRTGQDGELFAYIFFSAGGMGARAHRDGLSATAFPSGITGVPAEAIEAVAPVLLHRRALIRDSGGPGRFRGGLGQEMELEVVTGHAAVHSPMYDRTRNPAHGFAGGEAGSVGEVVHSDGRALHPKKRYTLQPGERFTLRLPGGGGYHPPWQRDPAAVAEDVRQGYVSAQAAAERYGVVIDPATGAVDHAASVRRRRALALTHRDRIDPPRVRE